MVSYDDVNEASFIPDPSYVLLNLKRVIDELRRNVFDTVHDYSIMTPFIIDYDALSFNQCTNMQKLYFTRLNNFEFH